MANGVLVKMANVIIIKWGILLTYLPYSTTFVPIYLPTYYNLFTYPPTHLPIGLSTSPPINYYLPIYLTTNPPTSLPTYLLTYPPTHLPPTTYLPTYFSFVMMCRNKHVK